MSNTSEIDLESADPSLIHLISSFSNGNAEKPSLQGRSTSFESFALRGFSDAQLRGRFEHRADASLLVWVVKALLYDRRDLGTIVLRYAMTAGELGDVWTDRQRCELRLNKYAEAHLRADLHLVRQGYTPAAVDGVTLIDHRGWAEGS